MIHFTVEIDPVAKGRPIFGRSYVRTPLKTVVFENQLKALSLKYRPSTPLLGPLKLSVVFFIKSPKVKKKKNKVYPCVRPDLDNYLKAVKDALNGLFWEDDAQVVLYDQVRKVYTSGIPKIEITINEMKEGE